MRLWMSFCKRIVSPLPYGTPFDCWGQVKEEAEAGELRLEKTVNEALKWIYILRKTSSFPKASVCALHFCKQFSKWPEHNPVTPTSRYRIFMVRKQEPTWDGCNARSRGPYDAFDLILVMHLWSTCKSRYWIDEPQSKSGNTLFPLQSLVLNWLWWKVLMRS